MQILETYNKLVNLCWGDCCFELKAGLDDAMLLESVTCVILVMHVVWFCVDPMSLCQTVVLAVHGCMSCCSADQQLIYSATIKI